MHIFIPLYLVYALIFGGGFVAAKTNATSSVVQSVSGLISPAATPPAAAK